MKRKLLKEDNDNKITFGCFVLKVAWGLFKVDNTVHTSQCLAEKYRVHHRTSMYQ